MWIRKTENNYNTNNYRATKQQQKEATDYKETQNNCKETQNNYTATKRRKITTKTLKQL